MEPNTHSVVFYGLSTCIHCKQAKDFLEKCGQPVETHYIDLAKDDERAKLLAKLREYNPGMSFPTCVIDDSKVIVGFRPEEMAKALEQ